MYSESDHKALVALLRGQVSANTLKSHIENREISSVSTEPLITTILDSFSLALSFMDSPTPAPPPHHDSLSQNIAGPVPRRSSYKKKICQAQVTENYRDDSPNPLLGDGFYWRKYGQKIIKTSQHQRSYYRCAYSKENNCKAAKRVQKIKDNPPVYRTTYSGKHTCAFAVDTNNDDDTYDSKIIHFDRCDHVVSGSVTPQHASVDHQAITKEDKATDQNQITDQECEDNEFLVDDDKLWACDFPPLSSGDLVFFDSFAAFD